MFENRLKGALLFCAFPACLLLSASANALDYDCDVPPDKFSSVVLTVSGPEYAASGAIRAVEKRRGRFLPLAGILIKRQDRQNTFAGFQLVPAASGEKYMLKFRRWGTDSDVDADMGEFSLDEDVPFHFSLLGNGMMRLSLAGRIFMWEAGPQFANLPRAKMQVMCSTGQFKFLGLELSDSNAKRAMTK